MIRLPPRSTRTDTLFPYTSLFRSICNEAAVAFGERVAHAMFGGEAFLRLRDPIMGAEDFAYVLEKVPGAMFFLGVSYKDADWKHCCGVHSTRSEERRVGTESVRTGRSRWAPYHLKTKLDAVLSS